VPADYDALVYDLDGTLVELTVDWEHVTEETAAVLSARGIDTGGMTLWDVLETADEESHRPKIEEIIREHERDGARGAVRLPLADRLPAAVPVAVCSLNCEAACRIALELHELDTHVDAIVGRGTVESHKPDPDPLLTAIRALEVSPSRALFVGDTERDERTAQAAGVPFQYASEFADS